MNEEVQGLLHVVSEVNLRDASPFFGVLPSHRVFLSGLARFGAGRGGVVEHLFWRVIRYRSR